MTKIACPLFTDVLLQYWHEYGFHLYHFKENFCCNPCRNATFHRCGLLLGLWMFFINNGMNKALHLYDLTRKTFLQSLQECVFSPMVFECSFAMLARVRKACKFWDLFRLWSLNGAMQSFVHMAWSYDKHADFSNTVWNCFGFDQKCRMSVLVKA